MDASTRLSSYDLFKLIVAIILLILFLLLLRRTTPQALAPTEFVQPTSSAAPRVNSTDIPGTSVSLSLTPTSNPGIESTSTSLPSPTGTVEFTPTDAFPSPGGTIVGAVSPTSPPLSTETSLPSPTAPTASQTPLPTPTSTPVIPSTPIPAETRSVMTACEAAASRSRLQTGMNARILRRLNFRSSPGIRDNWLRTNISGTIVEVAGGPECVPHLAGAYVWWQIRLPSGEIGWSAEGSIHGTFYFMEPVE